MHIWSPLEFESSVLVIKRSFWSIMSKRIFNPENGVNITYIIRVANVVTYNPHSPRRIIITQWSVYRIVFHAPYLYGD